VLTVLVAPRPDGVDDARLGVAVSTRHGKATRRNRIKRLIREAFRQVRSDLPGGWDYMIVPRAGVALTVTKLADSLRALARRATHAEPAPRPPRTGR